MIEIQFIFSDERTTTMLREFSDREDAILAAMYEYKNLVAWRTAENLVNSANFDSENNGFYWKDTAEKDQKTFEHYIKAACPAHADYLIDGLTKLIAAHMVNLQHRIDEAKR